MWHIMLCVWSVVWDVHIMCIVCPLKVEGLFEDIDFSTEVSRETLEDLCSDLFGHVKDVISDVLKNADMIMVRHLCVCVCVCVCT